MAAAELASAILTLPSPWRTWSRVVAGHVVRAWLERFAVPDGFDRRLAVPPAALSGPPQGRICARRLALVVELWRQGADGCRRPWCRCGAPPSGSRTASRGRALAWRTTKPLGPSWALPPPRRRSSTLRVQGEAGRVLCGATVIGGGGDADHDRGNSAYVVDVRTSRS